MTSLVDRPNFAFSPPDVAHLPELFARSRMRTPIIGFTLSCWDTSRIALKLFNLFHHHDDRLAQLAPEQRHLDVERVLVPVANHQRLGIAMDGQRRE